MPGHRRPLQALAAVAVGAALASTVDIALAAFSATAASGGNTVTAAADFRAPVVTTAAVAKASGGAAGFVKQGGSYFVYANVVADTGNPASGIASVTANVSNLTAGAASVAMTAGSFSAGGGSYGYRSASQTADAVLSQGARSLTVTATDAASNSDVKSANVTVDNTAPLAADVQTANAAANGLAEQGDSLTLTFSEPIEPASVLAGWTSGTTNVVVRLIDNGLLGAGNDAVQIFNAANSAQLPLGAIDLGRSDYVVGLLGGGVRFGASGTPSTMAIAGNSLTVTLGSYNATIIVDPSRTTAGGSGTLTWTPVATPYDRAQNALATTAASESGVADRDF